MRNRFLMSIVAPLFLAACETTEPVTAAEIEITPGQATLVSIGETVQLSAVVKDANGQEIAKAVTWSSSAATIASVDAAGLATAVANGQATITASVDGVTASITLDVAQVVASVVVAPATNQLASINQTIQLTATAKDALGNDVAGRTAAWTSSAASVASIVAGTGVARANANGSATMTATIDGKTGTASVTVAQVAAKLGFSAQPFTTQNGLSLPLVAVQVQDALGTAIASATNPVTLAIGANPANGTLAGTKEVAAQGGIASFAALSVDNVGAGYTLTASAPGLGTATSAAFDIMNVAVRIDSVVIKSSTVKIGGSTAYSMYVTVGREFTNAGIQGNIIQNNSLRGAGGVVALGCSPTNGRIPHGSCKMDWSLSVSGSQGLVAGEATARFDFNEGPVVRTQVSRTVTLVP